MSSKQENRRRTIRSYVSEKRSKYNISDNSYTVQLKSDHQIMLGGFLGIFCSFLFFTSIIQIMSSSFNLIWLAGILIGIAGLKFTRDIFKMFYDSESKE